MTATHIRYNGQLIDIDETLRELDRWDSEESLAHFLRTAWKYVDSATFIDGWVIDAIAEHLEAVVDGEIRRLIINVPPRSLKTTTCGIALCPFVWAQRHHSHTAGPGVKFLYASYSDKLSTDASVVCRRVLDSPWYQGLWGDKFKLSDDQNTKHHFSNDKGGQRVITSIGAGVTGRGGDIIVVDDANASNEVESDVKTQDVIDWWDGTLSSRLNDRKKSALVVIQQRLAQNDLTGHILEKNIGDWTHLMIPARYEADRSFVTSIGWKDPRTVEGELFWPERMGEPELREFEKDLGPWRAAGQLQQSPMPKGGGIIKRDWWLKWEGEFPPFSYILATLDTAYTEKTENDPSGIAIWGVFNHDVVAQYPRNVLGPTERSYTLQSPRVMLIDAWNERLDLHALVTKVAHTCKLRKVDKLRIENKASGISVAQEMRRLFGHEDWAVELFDPKGQDKMARLYSVQHIFAESMVYAPDREYAEMVIAQCEVFPKGRHDEQVDNTSSALRHLRDMGLLQRPPEVQQEIEDSMRHDMQRTPAPLYPA